MAFVATGAGRLPGELAGFPTGKIIFPMCRAIFPGGIAAFPTGIAAIPTGMVAMPEGIIIFPAGSLFCHPAQPLLQRELTLRQPEMSPFSGETARVPEAKTRHLPEK